MKATGKTILMTHRSKKYAIIFTDSPGSIKAKDNKRPCKAVFVNHMKFIIKRIARNISVAWLPSHKDVKSNESKGKVAKEVTRPSLISTLPTNTKDHIQHIKNEAPARKT